MSKKIALYKKAMKTAKAAQIKSEEVIQEHKKTTEMLSNARKIIKNYRKEGLIIPAKYYNKLLKYVKTDMSDRVYESAQITISDIIEHAKNLYSTFKSSRETLSEVLESIENVKNEGCDTTRPENLYTIAKEDFVAGRYEDATSTVKNALDYLNQKAQDFWEAKEAIDELKSAIATATEKDISTHGLIDSTIDAFQNHQYENALHHAKSAISTVEKYIKLYNDAEKNLKSCEKEITDVQDQIFTGDVEKHFAQAKDAFDIHEYQRCISIANECTVMLEKIKNTSEPIFSIALPTDELQPNIYNRCKMTVTNIGKVHAENIHISPNSDIVAIKGFTPISNLCAGESTEVDIALKSTELGSIPVNFVVECIPTTKDESIKTELSYWLNIGGEHVVVDQKVQILRETEYFAGFIRAKIAVENQLSSVITEVGLELIYDTNVLRFDHTEPDYIMTGNKINLGNVNPQERKTVAVYLDPMMCTTTHFDALVYYKDSVGNLKTCTMSRKEVNVVKTPSPTITTSPPNPITHQRQPIVNSAPIISQSQTNEDRILDYIESHDGRVSISKCSAELRLSKEEIKATLQKLEREGRLS